MSKRWRDPRRKDSRFSGSAHVELQRRRPVPPSTWSLRDKLSLAGGILLMIVAVLLPAFLKAGGQRKLISQRLENWQNEFGLQPAQIEELRSIEYKFHGSGNPISDPGPPTESEVADHHKRIASIMGEQAGKRYLEQTVGKNH